MDNCETLLKITAKHIEIGFSETLFACESITLEAGKCYSLIGKNGSGKSTFMQTLLGHIPLRNGQLFLDNRPIETIKPAEQAKLIAFVASKFDGVQHLSVREYITLGRAPYTNFLGKTTQKDTEKVLEIIELLSIEKLANKDTTEISDGERQIVSIARALAQETPIILLDEPTAFLDYANRLHVLKILRKIAHEQQTCIIQSSHDLELCMTYSDALLLVNPIAKKLEEIAPTDKQAILKIAFPELGEGEI